MACGVAFIQFFFWCETYFFPTRQKTCDDEEAIRITQFNVWHTTTQCTVKWMEKVSYRVSILKLGVYEVWSLYRNLTHSSSEQLRQSSGSLCCQSCAAPHSSCHSIRKFIDIVDSIANGFDSRISTVSNENPVCRRTKNSMRSQLIFYSNSLNCIEYQHFATSANLINVVTHRFRHSPENFGGLRIQLIWKKCGLKREQKAYLFLESFLYPSRSLSPSIDHWASKIMYACGDVDCGKKI